MTGADLASISVPAADPHLPAPPALRAVCWGVRGSIPSPGPGTVRYGGNTSCLEVRTGDGRRLVFDAGTGIRALSLSLEAAPDPVEADLFLTHFHWDHIQGFPFCGQLYDRERPAKIRVHGPRQGDVAIDRVLAAQMASTYFPVPLDAVSARVEYRHVDEAPWRHAGLEVAALRVRHPGHTCGYRVRFGGASLAYVPDNDLGADDGAAGADYRDLVRFLRGVDVLYHDSMFTDEEYDRFRGWGHSTYRQAVRLAEDAGVARLHLFHHAPDRTDDALDAVLGGIRGELAARGAPLVVTAAAEGDEIALPAREAP